MTPLEPGPDTGTIAEGPTSRQTVFGWFLLLCFLLNFAQGVFPPLLPQMMESLGLSFASVGLLGTAFGVARFLVDLPAGILAERWGTARILHADIGFVLLGTGLSAWGSSVPTLLLARTLVGIGSGMSIVISILYLMAWGPAVQRTRRSNTYEAAAIAGIAVSTAFGGMIATRWGWRWSFAMAALVIGLAWVVAFFRVVPGAREILRDEETFPSASQRTPRVFGSGIVAACSVSFGLAVAWAGGISILLPLYGGLQLNLTSEILGRVMAFAYGIEVCLLFPVGWASDVLGRIRVMVPGLLVMMVGTALVPSVHTLSGYGLVSTLMAVGMTVWMIPPALLAERLPGGLRGKAVGVYRLISDVGFMVAPAAIGWLIGRAGFGMAAAVVAAVLAASVCVSVTLLRGPQVLRRKVKKKTAP